MWFAKANPNEFLVVGHRGRIENRGPAASAILWPGDSYVLLPSTEQEAIFEMRQESRDGIPLLFKGVVIYRIDDPVTAATRFNFTQGNALAEINAKINHVSLGELRETVSHMTMVECIEQRKTTLTDAVGQAVRAIAHGQAGAPGWGIHIDVVSVAQVFIVDDELRRQLEAEIRNQLKSTGELSNIKTQEGIQKAQLESKRRLQKELLAAERERLEVEQEKERLEKAFEKERLEADLPIRLLRMENEETVLNKELSVRQIEHNILALTVEGKLMEERARHALRLELLPVEQRPQIAEALASTFQSAQWTLYGESQSLIATLTPAIDALRALWQEVGMSERRNTGE